MARQRFFTTLNVLGLAIGLACALILMRFVQNELSYDRDIVDADRIWRFAVDIENADLRTNTARTGWAAGGALIKEIDSIEEMTRLIFARNQVISRDENSATVDLLAHAEPNAMTFFSVPLVEGDPATALQRPNTTVIHERIAAILFPDGDAIGKTIQVNHGEPLEVTGIFRSPGPRHFNPEVYVSQTEEPDWGNAANLWLALAYHTYIKIKPDATIAQVQGQIPGVIERNASEYLKMTGMKFYPRLTPLTNIHLHSQLAAEIENNGDYTRVILFASIALIVVLIACINFINLTTARSTSRAAEVGLRKVVGAQRGSLVGQFLTESLMLTGSAFLIAVLLAYLMMPLFDRIAAQNLHLDLMHNSILLLSFIGLFFVVGLIAGGIPALTLSNFRPIDVVRGQLRRGPAGRRIRSGLVILQFTASVTLIAGTLVVARQLHYLSTMDLGYQKEHVIILRLMNPELQQRAETLKERLLADPRIVSAAASSVIPGRPHGSRLFMPEGVPDDEAWRAGIISVDPEYVKTFGITMASGRFFDPARPADSSAWIINETLARKLGWENPLTHTMDYPPRGYYSGPIIGVVRDYHHLSLHNPVEPMVFRLADDRKSFLAVRVTGVDLPGTLAMMSSVWKEFAPGWPFEYSFLEENLEANYDADRRFGELFGTFASLAILVAALGLLGLAAFTAEQRTSEIGVRKVLGANVPDIVLLLTKDFLTLVLLSNLIAWPIVYWTLSKWLDGFAYHTNVGLLPVAGALLLSLIVAVGTVSGHAIRAAHLNPARTIRTE